MKHDIARNLIIAAAKNFPKAASRKGTIQSMRQKFYRFHTNLLIYLFLNIFVLNDSIIILGVL
jgi:hypothetical protein